MKRFFIGAARVIRAVSVPPVLALAMTLILALHPDAVLSLRELALAVLFLVIVPVLAYPLQPLFPAFRGRGREGQRDLAFLFTIAGYAAGVVCVFVFPISEALCEIFISYFISVLFLTVCNKLLKQRASGHAAGVTGALVFPVLFLGWFTVPMCLAVYAVTLWSSVYLGRHTAKEFLLGTCCSLLSFALGVALCRALP